MTSREMVQGAAARNQRTLADSGSKTLALSRTMEWTSIHRHLKSNRDMNSIGAPSRMTVLLMTEIPFQIKILIHGCNMNFQMYGLQIA